MKKSDFLNIKRWMGLPIAYGMRTGGMDGSKKAKILRTYYVHSPQDSHDIKHFKG